MVAAQQWSKPAQEWSILPTMDTSPLALVTGFPTMVTAAPTMVTAIPTIVTAPKKMSDPTQQQPQSSP